MDRNEEQKSGCGAAERQTPQEKTPGAPKPSRKQVEPGCATFAPASFSQPWCSRQESGAKALNVGVWRMQRKRTHCDEIERERQALRARARERE
ncbi:hypothetical protein BCV70DRAFT_72478 [Testicularia cyperi]|uniref:Uncharacterized protein n=1 Tax=Testicularia cyperi TaxID=1882483 RepID=A0A317XU65_9BASI|nr:hypothetical protein BCV70DRAFT_72478 [Testicularia cyperi]